MFLEPVMSNVLGSGQDFLLHHKWWRKPHGKRTSEIRTHFLLSDSHRRYPGSCLLVTLSYPNYFAKVPLPCTSDTWHRYPCEHTIVIGSSTEAGRVYCNFIFLMKIRIRNCWTFLLVMKMSLSVLDMEGRKKEEKEGRVNWNQAHMKMLCIRKPMYGN